MEDCLKKDKQLQELFFQKKPVYFNQVEECSSGKSACQPQVPPPQQGKLTLKLHSNNRWFFKATSATNHIILERNRLKKRKLTGFNFSDDTAIYVAKRLKLDGFGKYKVPHTAMGGMREREMTVPQQPLYMRDSCSTCEEATRHHPPGKFIVDSFPRDKEKINLI